MKTQFELISKPLFLLLGSMLISNLTYSQKDSIENGEIICIIGENESSTNSQKSTLEFESCWIAPPLEAQQTKKIDLSQNENEIYQEVEVKAKPDYDWKEFVKKNLRFPTKGCVEGKVFVKFIVEKDGKLSNIKVIRGWDLGHGLPEEAIRLISNAPNWKPAEIQGKAVRSYFILPIIFKLIESKNNK